MKKIEASEKEIQNTIIEWLNAKRIFCYRQNSGSFIDKAKHYYKFASIDGLPDIVVIVRGRYIGLEVKRKGGKQRDSQIETERAIKNAGGNYFTVYSLEEAMASIESTQKNLP